MNYDTVFRHEAEDSLPRKCAGRCEDWEGCVRCERKRKDLEDARLFDAWEKERLGRIDPEAAESRKREGMFLAARRKKEVLAACQVHLVKVAMEGDGTATADDARAYTVSNNLEPLGNAAGSLFRGRWWKQTGERRASVYTSNHSHHNPVWELVREFLPKEFRHGS
jgi:hypothetical protein